MNTAALEWIAALTGLVAIAIEWVRWARVIQREHYLSGAVWRIARLWITARRINALLIIVAVAATVVAATADSPAIGILAALAIAAFPWFLPLRAPERPLRWTRRLLTLTAIAAGLAVILGAVIAIVIAPWMASLVVATFLVVIAEVAIALARPIENRIALGYQQRAQARLRQVDPTVIAVTGSWGKTTTKNHIRQLSAPLVSVAMSPASYNNRAGLSRTMNEHLPDGTELLVVEMGMYGTGEIRALCDWVQPQIGVICAIGPMHLERVGSMDGIIAAKSEIVEQTTTAVLWVEHPALAALADRLSDQRVVRCGRTRDADIAVLDDHGDEWPVLVAGNEIGRVPASAGLHAGNIACAVGALVAAGFSASDIGRSLPALQAPEHRATLQTSERGIITIDDTFNSNPVGARRALEQLLAAGDGRRIVVTPGMMELGTEQHRANAEFAAAVVAAGAELVIVGRTNRRSLLAGAAGAAVWVPDRRRARELLGASLASGDAVLWENDLPDHYP